MKKVYIKPQICFESFSLSTNIAGGCDFPFTGAAQDICAIPDGNGLGMGVFNPSVAGSECIIPGNDDSEMYNGFCYHVPSKNNQLFAS